MTRKIFIRRETPLDVRQITEVTVATLPTLEISNPTEPFIIEALRAAQALTLSLVAEVDARVEVHIAFSPLTVSDGTRNWDGLGPVSVLPEYQGRGTGAARIREGLSRLRAMQAHGCCLVGHPGYYQKLGFKNLPGLVYEGVPAEVFFAPCFHGHPPQGTGNVPRRIQSGWPTRGRGRRFAAHRSVGGVRRENWHFTNWSRMRRPSRSSALR